MSAPASAPTPMPSPAPSATPLGTHRVTGWRVSRSEWAKLWSLRSTWIVLGLTLLFIGFPGLTGAIEYRDQYAGRWDVTAVDISLLGVDFAHLALAALGVLVMAGEYSTGLIRSTLAAVPRRYPVLYAKAVVYGLVALAVSAFGALVTFLAAGPVLAGTPAAQSLTDDGVLRCLLGAGLYFGLVSVIGVALGTLLRSVAAGITAIFGVLFLIPGLIGGLASLQPGTVWEHIYRYLPSVAGGSMYAPRVDPGDLSPSAGLAVLLGWTALTLAVATVRLLRSDA